VSDLTYLALRNYIAMKNMDGKYPF